MHTGDVRRARNRRRDSVLRRTSRLGNWANDERERRGCQERLRPGELAARTDKGNRKKEINPRRAEAGALPWTRRGLAVPDPAGKPERRVRLLPKGLMPSEGTPNAGRVAGPPPSGTPPKTQGPQRDRHPRTRAFLRCVGESGETPPAFSWHGRKMRPGRKHPGSTRGGDTGPAHAHNTCRIGCA